MKLHQISSVVIGVMVCAIATPAFAFPADSVTRSAIAKNEAGIGAYQITFSIGGMREEVRIPVVGERGLQSGARTTRFGYQLEAERPSTVVAQTGAATALMISKAPIEDGMYVVKPGERFQFTALAVYTAHRTEGNEYRFRLIELPFFVGKEKTPQHFTPSELKYFFTEAEDLYFNSDTQVKL